MNPKEKDSGEGSISATECLDALKVMGERKSHGMDGFTVEFYKFFWKDPSIKPEHEIANLVSTKDG